MDLNATYANTYWTPFVECTKRTYQIRGGDRITRTTNKGMLNYIFTILLVDPYKRLLAYNNIF